MQMELSSKELESELKYVKKISKKGRKSLWMSRIGIWIMLFIVLFPIVSILGASLSQGSSFTQTSLLPSSYTLDNYKKLLTDTNFTKWLFNSVFVSAVSGLIQLSFVIPAAFAFSKLRFAFRSKGLMALLILQMFPTSMALPAILRVAYNNNLMDNLPVIIILMCTGMAYNIWLMKGYMDGVPTDLIEAAYVDGATTAQAFVKIVLPLIKNMALVIFLFAFINAYSEFMMSSALLKDSAVQTIAVGMRNFINDKFSSNWTVYSAGAVLSSLPVVVLFLCCQKFIAKGLTAGAVKG